jgi:hypothetical protein
MILPNKIVQRFYETPAPLKAGRDLISERLKFLSSYLNSSRAAPKVGISASLQQAAGNSNLKSKYNARIKLGGIKLDNRLIFKVNDYMRLKG